MSKAIIYKIQNLVSGRAYIGSTIRSWQRRKSEHLSLLRRGVHINTRLQNAFLKYGEVAFEFSMIEEIEISLIGEREDYWINGCKKKSYNIRRTSGSNVGCRHSNETKQKIAKSLMGRCTRSADAIKKTNDALRGKKKPQHVVAAARLAVKKLWETRREEMLWKCRKLTIENIRYAKEEKLKGKSQAQIARELGVSATTICHLFQGKKYAECLAHY